MPTMTMDVLLLSALLSDAAPASALTWAHDVRWIRWGRDHLPCGYGYGLGEGVERYFGLRAEWDDDDCRSGEVEIEVDFEAGRGFQRWWRGEKKWRRV